MVTVCPSQFATRRTLFHVLVGCGLLMLKVSRLKLPVIWLLVSMWLNTLTKSQIWTLLLKRSEERRVGKECRSRWSAYQLKKKKKNTTLRISTLRLLPVSRAKKVCLRSARQTERTAGKRVHYSLDAKTILEATLRKTDEHRDT